MFPKTQPSQKLSIPEASPPDTRPDRPPGPQAAATRGARAPMRETHNSRVYGHFHDWDVISLFIPFQPLCQLIYIATIAHQFQINILTPDAEQHPVVPDSLAIESMERWLEPDYIALERIIPHFIEMLQNSFLTATVLRFQVIANGIGEKDIIAHPLRTPDQS